MFHEIPDTSVVLKRKGLYKQTTLFAYAGQVFARHGGGFIKLFKHSNGTSVPDVQWEDLQLPGGRAVPAFSHTGVMLTQGQE